MFLLDALRRILGRGQDKQEKEESVNPPILKCSRSPPHEDRLYRHESRPPLPSPCSIVDSRGISKSPYATSSLGHGNRTISYPSFSSSVRDSSTPAQSSSKPSFPPVSSTNTNISVPGHSVGPDKYQISQERPVVSTLLSKSDSLYTSSSSSSSAKGSIPPAPQSKASSSKNPSLATVSSTNSSVSEAPVRVWQKNKQTWTESSREYVHNLPALSPSLIKVNVSFDSSSTSEASSPSSSLESGISNRRVLPKYEIPKYLEEMIRNDIVPPVLRCSLSPSTYRDFFATLLYAEDFYAEKWSEYLLEGIELELRRRINSTNSKESSMKSRINSTNSTESSMKRKNNTMLVERDFVAFEIDSVPERRPYLLSRDFVFLKPLNEIAEPFKGRLFQVEKRRFPFTDFSIQKSTTVLVEFGDDFHSQHSPSKRYDVSFSFNRVCLKRAHQAISVASDPSFRSILFPDQSSFSSHPNTFQLLHQNAIQFQDHVRRILNHKGPIPYLLNGQLVVTESRPYDQSDQGRCQLSSTGLIIQAAILNMYRTNPRCRILVCSPTNNTCDVLLRSLTKQMPKSSLFRANAAYRDYDLVPDDIIPASLYEEDEECFACPPLAELLNFNIIICTFMSSYRLHAAGIDSEHFTHIFLVDASLATEPETIVPLANLAGKNTVIVLTGCPGKSPSSVRADIARRHGLKVSYFNRLLAMEPYKSNDSIFTAHIA